MSKREIALLVYGSIGWAGALLMVYAARMFARDARQAIERNVQYLDGLRDLNGTVRMLVDVMRDQREASRPDTRSVTAAGRGIGERDR
jgi:hypothetical protein